MRNNITNRNLRKTERKKCPSQVSNRSEINNNVQEIAPAPPHIEIDALTYAFLVTDMRRRQWVGPGLDKEQPFAPPPTMNEWRP